MSARVPSSQPFLPHVGRVAGLVGLALVVATFHVWTRTRVVKEGYHLAAVQQEHSRLTSERDRLTLEVGALTMPRTLEAFARTKLGMAPPDPGPVWAGRGSGGDDHLTGTAEPARYLAGGVAPRPDQRSWVGAPPRDLLRFASQGGSSLDSAAAR